MEGFSRALNMSPFCLLLLILVLLAHLSYSLPPTIPGDSPSTPVFASSPSSPSACSLSSGSSINSTCSSTGFSITSTSTATSCLSGKQKDCPCLWCDKMYDYPSWLARHRCPQGPTPPMRRRRAPHRAPRQAPRRAPHRARRWNRRIDFAQLHEARTWPARVVFQEIPIAAWLPTEGASYGATPVQATVDEHWLTLAALFAARAETTTGTTEVPLSLIPTVAPTTSDSTAYDTTEFVDEEVRWIISPPTPTIGPLVDLMSRINYASQQLATAIPRQPLPLATVTPRTVSSWCGVVDSTDEPSSSWTSPRKASPAPGAAAAGGGVESRIAPSDEVIQAWVDSMMLDPSKFPFHFRVFFSNGTAAQHRYVMEVIEQWSNHGNLFFDVVTQGDSDIRIAFIADAAVSWSMIGPHTAPVTADITMLLSFPSKWNAGLKFDSWLQRWLNGTILHEFGHALGFEHEHQHLDAGIPFNRDAVYAAAGYGQECVEAERAGETNESCVKLAENIEHNWFYRYDRAFVFSDAALYDPLSIMHYPVPKELLADEFYPVTGFNWQLSDLDKRIVGFLFPGKEMLVR